MNFEEGSLPSIFFNTSKSSSFVLLRRAYWLREVAAEHGPNSALFYFSHPSTAKAQGRVVLHGIQCAWVTFSTLSETLGKAKNSITSSSLLLLLLSSSLGNSIFLSVSMCVTLF